MAEVEDEEIHRAALEGRTTSVVKMPLLEGHERLRYNLPFHEEVAVAFLGDDDAPPASREIVIYPRGQSLKTILFMSANLDPMVYPIFFLRDDAGWYNQLEHNPDHATCVRNHVTLSQNKQYDALHEHVIYRANDLKVRPGRVVILPSSYVGSPRALKENFEDAMAVLKKYCKPDLFITFTCNPKWREIVENLNPGQTVNEKPDLVCRVFKMKLKPFFEDIFKHEVFGKVISHLEKAEDIDCLISAEIPDLAVDPELRKIIKSCMIHGPYGTLNPNSSRMKDKKCTKKFPKEFNSHTVAVFNG
ncbi:uncharacterized protein LOC136073125 isoform X2 [Hydra vulgaris]|uniref:Uncharacterized protein LOC136073125 isoform X2 n=1 Tax=Hydra vulgaris TaxID=6087 RepID=A0ABM4DHH9_HYDVU